MLCFPLIATKRNYRKVDYRIGSAQQAESEVGGISEQTQHFSNPIILIGLMLVFADCFVVSKESFSSHSSYEYILLHKLEQN